jgi:hypothetical protein
VDHRLDRRDGQRAPQIRVRQDRAADRHEPPRQGGEVATGALGQRDAIEPDHVAAGGQQVCHDVEGDEAGGAGDQDGHGA